MSTNFCPLSKIRADQLFDGRLEEFDVVEHINGETHATKRCLRDGNNYLWVHIGEDGFVTCFTRYAPNGCPSKTLNAVGEAFDTCIVSEYDPRFWGFDTQAEWDAATELMAKESEEKFYVSVTNYVRGQPNDILPGTIGALQADIAKKLVEEDPTLLAVENKDQLLRKISVYDRDRAVKITLTQEDIALVEMLATHEDDLPSA